MSHILDLTRSKLRRALFSLYFSNPDSESYVRELERLLGFSAANIRRELVTQTNDGLFTSRKQGNLVYYSLNKNNPVYEELKSIVFKTIGIEGSLREIIAPDIGIELAYIYGSFAAGGEAPSSDVDLMIVGHPNEDALMKRIGELEGKVSREINYTIYSHKEYVRKRKDRDSLIVNLESRPRIMLVQRVNYDD